MKQLRQSKFKKGTTEYENISSPNGEVKAFKVNSVSGNLEYTTDYTNFSEVGGGQEVLTGATDPTTATVGEVGQFYLNTTTNALFQCQSAGGGSYTWGVPNVNAVTLGTETQTFEESKTLKLPNARSIYFISLYDNTERKYVSILPYSSGVGSAMVELSNGQNGYEKLALTTSGIRRNNIGSSTGIFSFPAYTKANGTFALTSDIPTALTNQEIDDIMDAILV